MARLLPCWAHFGAEGSHFMALCSLSCHCCLTLPYVVLTLKSKREDREDRSGGKNPLLALNVFILCFIFDISADQRRLKPLISSKLYSSSISSRLLILKEARRKLTRRARRLGAKGTAPLVVEPPIHRQMQEYLLTLPEHHKTRRPGQTDRHTTETRINEHVLPDVLHQYPNSLNVFSVQVHSRPANSSPSSLSTFTLFLTPTGS